MPTVSWAQHMKGEAHPTPFAALFSRFALRSTRLNSVFEKNILFSF